MISYYFKNLLGCTKGLFILSLLFSSNLVAQDSDDDSGDDFETNFYEAIKNRAIDNTVGALENLENCYAIDSTSVAVLFEFSKNYLNENKLFEALTFIDKALYHKSSNEDLLSHKVQIQEQQSQYDKAIEIQKKIAEKNPVRTPKLVDLYIKAKKYEQAEKLIKELTLKGRHTVKTLAYKKTLIELKGGIKSETLSNNKIDTSLEGLRASFVQQKDYKTLKKILEIEEANKQFDLLLKDSEEGLKLFPVQPNLYMLNSKAHYQKGNYQKAVSQLKAGLDYTFDEKQKQQFYQLLIDNYTKLNNVKEADKYREKQSILKN